MSTKQLSLLEKIYKVLSQIFRSWEILPGSLDQAISNLSAYLFLFTKLILEIMLFIFSFLSLFICFIAN